ncbi:MAG: 23S rRNA (guanosine(2251)-2'-O)-methyltransferase RlmB [Deltaproteobacteria bacterium]|nr:MAG: 23S rRNA (guanosine(2251)-2'-O)-methyltransferase RlmB [Deltaproteobacteria bacterium]
MAGEGPIVAGVHPVVEALRTRPDAAEALLYTRPPGRGPMRRIAALAKRARVPMRRVDRSTLDAMAGTPGHQGVVLRLKPGAAALPAVTDPLDLVASAQEAARDPLLLLLDRVQDPRNLGAIVRSAYYLGADGVVVPRDRAAAMSEAAVKASAGTAFHLPVVTVTNLGRSLDRLREAGLWLAAADPEGAEAADQVDLTGPLALVVGGEGSGIRPGIRQRCDLLVRIPMGGRPGSLNAAVAASILLWEVRRQRRAVDG